MNQSHRIFNRRPVRPKPRKSQSFFRSSCAVCGKDFKSYSHFDAICDLCWADNEMRPYSAAPLNGRKVRIAH
jgi:hypothetical protein